MTKHFCDSCGAQLNSDNRGPSRENKQFGRVNVMEPVGQEAKPGMTSGDYWQVCVSFDYSHGGYWHLCRYCANDVVESALKQISQGAQKEHEPKRTTEG